jgi:NADH-quinone oxidoreductase subunit E
VVNYVDSKKGDLVEDQLAEIFARFEDHKKGALIPILQKIQVHFGYLSPEAITATAKFLKISASDIFGVATFYAQFRFTRPGDHQIRVCLGTACHVRGAELVMDAMERELGIEPGGTTDDFKFGLEKVACFGSCALAPVAVFDEDVYGRMTPAKARETLNKYR